MNGGSFEAGMLGLTNWVGNAVMPILAVLILALGIFKYSRGYHIEPYIAGTMSALSVSGLLRLAEVFASQGSGTTQYWAAIRKTRPSSSTPPTSNPCVCVCCSYPAPH